MIDSNNVKIDMATTCGVCRKRLQPDGCIYLCESDVYPGYGSSTRIMGWHRDCCPEPLKQKYDDKPRSED